MSPQTESDAQPESRTVEMPVDLTPDEPPAPEPGRRRRSGFWPEISGALAIGLCVLAAAVIVFQIAASAQGKPGPGLLTVGGHVLAATLAVLVQRFADRRRGWPRTAAVLGVTAIAATTLWIFWWA